MEPPNQVISYYVRKDGVKSQSLYTPRPAYARRIGAKSTLNSSTGKDGRFRPCVHDQERYSVVPLVELHAEKDYETVGPVAADTIVEGRFTNILRDVHRQGYAQFKNACDSATTSLNGVQWSALGETAIQNMTPSFSGDNSLVNFVLELKDFKDIFKYLATGFRKKLSRLDNFRVKDNLGNERIINITERDKPLQWMSKKYLAYNFGWLPLYNDVVALYESISGFEATFREMIRRESIPQQRYWGTTIPGTSSALSTPYFNSTAGPEGGWLGACSNRFRVRVTMDACEGIRYHAAMRYRYKLPSDIFGVGGKLKAYKDLLGINGNPAILWNAIPFSFIIDWIVNVSGYLERLKVDNIQIQTEILDFCHSARIERNVSLSIGSEKIFAYYNGGTLVRLPRAERVLDTCKKISYKRLVGIPNFRAAILQNNLSPRKFALAGALGGARRGY